ncbi:MAG TPA: endonuclease domain-containing protein [Deltaproteobacteria bacterium]|nr:endonuclease domain-containing protein [Deltaproteobacteria bacterium]HQB39137.1 endonuclease domain-containing protein [Deltaproteobacteria bacterium]
MSFQKNDHVLLERRRILRRNQTEAEKMFWSKVRNKQFLGLKFFRQYSFGAYILDFFCPAAALAVELDGGQHNCEDVIAYDAVRSEYLKASGIRVVRFWNNDVLTNIDGVFAALERELMA